MRTPANCSAVENGREKPEPHPNVRASNKKRTHAGILEVRGGVTFIFILAGLKKAQTPNHAYSLGVFIYLVYLLHCYCIGGLQEVK